MRDDEKKDQAAMKARMSALSDEQLLDIVQQDAGDYTDEALAAAETELTARGVVLEPDRDDEEDAGDDDARDGRSDSGEDDEREYDAAHAGAKDTSILPRRPCTGCGGFARYALLASSRDLKVVFPEDDKERTVNAYACRRCGHVELVVELPARRWR
ncbi:MAG: hypothetical protein U0166_27785 [Acidobacteriota bacterium]